MAASQQMRRENVTDERKIEVEKDKVPKMTTHFESLAVKSKGEHDTSPLHVERFHHVEAVPVRVAGVEVHEKMGETESDRKKKHEEEKKESLSERKTEGAGEKAGSALRMGAEKTEREVVKEQKHGEQLGMVKVHEGGETRKEQPSLEEVSNFRAQAQQKSNEAIRAAQERYEKAKEALPKIKDTSVEGIQSGALYASEKGGVLLEKGQQAKDYTAQKAMEAKDVVASKAGPMKDTAMEKSQQAMGYTAQKAAEAKDVLATKGQTASEYAAAKARAAKDTAVDTTVTAAGYVQDKAVAAKDVTLESSKGAAGYAGQVAGKVKDQAVVAGWAATHYTMEKVAEATKAVAGVTASAGHTVAGFTGEKLAAAKDVVVSTEEKVAEYAAKKQEEAKKDLEAKRAPHVEAEARETETFPGGQQHETKEKVGAVSEKIQETFEGGTKTASEGCQQHEGGTQHEQGQKQGSGGGVFRAIGETIVEIGQTTKDLIVGQDPTNVIGQKDETKDVEEPYRGAGEGI